jgi:hypothetical protein
MLVRVYLLPLTDLFYRFAAEFVCGVLKEIGRSVAKKLYAIKSLAGLGLGRRGVVR